ncbi:MAG TPA: class I SAM-dependent methyltransferase [Thermoanaerobaculia bacterium]|nr:class I SAM-dependent methyltransferase [Thermoanaerobaculia bacterium]
MTPGGTERTRWTDPQRLLVTLLFTYLPFAMSGHLLVNHVLGGPWYWYSAFLYPEGVLTVVVCVVTLCRAGERERLFDRLSGPGGLWWILGVAGAFVVWLAASAILQRAPTGFWIERLLAGWVLPMALALALLARADGVSDAWAGLRLGLAAFVPFALALYLFSFGIPSSFRELVVLNRTWKMVSGVRGKVYFGELTLGGINDVAVFVAAALALAGGLWLVDRRSRASRRVLWAWFVAGLVLELLCYSRGAIVSLALVAAFYAAASWRFVRLRALRVPAALLTALVAVALALPGAWPYWSNQLRVGPGSTARVRLTLWRRILTVNAETATFGGQLPAPPPPKPTPSVAPPPPAEPPAARAAGAGSATAAPVVEEARERIARFTSANGRQRVLGFGLGNYGLLQGMTEDACTHSMFLDALAHGGLPGAVFFAAFWCLGLGLAARAVLLRPVPSIGTPVPASISVAAALCVLTFAGGTVSFQFWNLGTMLNGAFVWLLVITSAATFREAQDRKGQRWKAETVEQWGADPCGGVEASEFGTPEYFTAVTKERYEIYAPWLPAAAGFSRAAGVRLLEVGFGLGTDLVSFSRGGASAFGVDLTPLHVFATRRRFLQQGLPVRVVRGDAERLPFKAGAFDRVYSFGVLHHTPGIETALAEIHRVLTAGGGLTLGLYHRDSLYWAYQLLVRGILKAGFLRHGYRRTMAGVEKSSRPDAETLVRAYSQKDVRLLLRAFRGVRLSVEHFSFDQGGRIGLVLGRILRPFEDRLARKIGWYVMADARKQDGGVSAERAS